MVVWLGQSDNLATLGGKSAQLSRLFPRYPIPSGFCLPTDVFEEWVAQGSPGQLPAPWQAAVADAYQKLSDAVQLAPLPVAVRSSAVDEDGQRASFAGQYESFLNICGVEALFTAILACWHSAFAERVQHYRRGAQTPLAVLVQQLVPADMAMVAFSRHPVTRSPEVVINAVWGLGQGLVDGSVTPDTYVVSPDQTLVQRTIGAKETMVVRFAAGIKQVPTPRLMRGQAVLSEAQIQEVAQLTRRLEGEMGWPVDVEAAYWQNRLYLLQCRPITA